MYMVHSNLQSGILSQTLSFMYSSVFVCVHLSLLHGGMGRRHRILFFFWNGGQVVKCIGQGHSVKKRISMGMQFHF